YSPTKCTGSLIKKTVQGGVQLSLTIVDTPGLGDVVDNSKLHDKVSVIPLIAKADTLTPEECHLFKKQIMKEIQEHKIKIYEFPDVDKDDDNKLVQKIKEKMPLAVVGSNVVIEVNSKKVRGRQYPWGVAEVENGEHCDFCRYTNSFFYCSKDLTGVCTLNACVLKSHFLQLTKSVWFIMVSVCSYQFTHNSVTKKSPVSACVLNSHFLQLTKSVWFIMVSVCSHATASQKNHLLVPVSLNPISSSLQSRYGS
uniref:Septin-type G domain-containing protein n=1 Tax=Oreochromis aureus TaxID=47969 RepID=A0AAZ1X1G9_OREAU